MRQTEDRVEIKVQLNWSGDKLFCDSGIAGAVAGLRLTWKEEMGCI